MNELDKTLRERLLNMETHELSTRANAAGADADHVGYEAEPRQENRVSVCLLLSACARPSASAGLHSERKATGGSLCLSLFMIFAFLVCVAWTVLTGWAAISGLVRRTHRPWIVATTLAMGFFYLVVLMFVFVVPIAHEESRVMLGTQLALIGFFLLNMIGLCVILGVLYRGQFQSQEKLLEIEYRLAELMEKIEGRQSR